MKKLLIGATALAVMTSPVVMAQPDNHRGGGYEQGGQRDNGRHRGWSQDRGNGHRWNRGERMGYNDWNSAQRVDYRQYHLRQPPRGYEWRRQNDQFIMVAVTTGLIMSIIMNSSR